MDLKPGDKFTIQYTVQDGLPEKMTHAEAFASLQRELSAQPDVVPEGWLTAEQWAEKTGVSEQHTRYTIRKAMAGGKMERSKFRIPSGGRFVSQPHYRIK